MSDSSPDRRSSHRAAIDVLANRFLDGYPYLCRAIDISPGGMRVERFNEPEARSRFIGLQFQLPGSADVLTASGEVVSDDADSRAIGIRFTRLPAPSAAAIERYLASGGASGEETDDETDFLA
jgi:hypothetical protein